MSRRGRPRKGGGIGAAMFWLLVAVMAGGSVGYFVTAGMDPLGRNDRYSRRDPATPPGEESGFNQLVAAQAEALQELRNSVAEQVKREGVAAAERVTGGAPIEPEVRVHRGGRPDAPVEDEELAPGLDEPLADPGG